MAKPNQLDVRALTGADLGHALADVARLRIEVFRDWPYLYDGDFLYEESYLQTYRNSDRAIVVGAYDGADLVGASTGTPLADHEDDFVTAFDGTGLAMDDVFYCAESVLLPGYRGHGAGHRFFDIREAHARHLGFSKCCFCAVMRPENHPQRPKQYRSLEPFWQGRAYAPLKGVVAQFSWNDVGQTTATAKPLQFWIKDL